MCLYAYVQYIISMRTFITSMVLILISSIILLTFCTGKNNEETTDLVSAEKTEIPELNVPENIPPIDTISPDQIEIEKNLLYNQYTLNDTYPYKNTTRKFQWDKIKKGLAKIENIQKQKPRWGILQNYKNKNGEAPLVKTYRRNAYKLIEDTFSVSRYQSVPLYILGDSIPFRYGRDGSLVKILEESAKFTKVETIDFPNKWMAPTKYIKDISDTIVFKKAIFVDVTNQNITTLEKVDSKWLVRSMNPATTGVHRPPYAHETPLGMYVIQEKREKMVYLADGSTDIGGFAPYASRFTNGAYIHGIPVNAPRTKIIEYSASLGTTPRSHMCVRNATSHAKFVYDWGLSRQTIVFVLE